MKRAVGVGDILYGFCQGFFGRDSYGEKTIEAIGRDWVVVREDDEPIIAVFSPGWQLDKMNELLSEWSDHVAKW